MGRCCQGALSSLRAKRTRREAAFPRRVFARVMRKSVSLEKAEGAGNAGCTPHPLPCVQMKETHAGQHRYAEITPAFPARWVDGCSVISPVNQLFCHRRLQVASQACPLHWRDRTTRLDRTRLLAIVSLAFASTAPRLTYRDDWPNVPLHEAGWGLCNAVSDFRQEIYF